MAIEKIDIKDAGFSVRTLNILRFINNYDRESVITLHDVANVSSYELRRQPNCGRKTIEEIREVLAGVGLYLKDDPAKQTKPGFGVIKAVACLAVSEAGDYYICGASGKTLREIKYEACAAFDKMPYRLYWMTAVVQKPKIPEDAQTAVEPV